MLIKIIQKVFMFAMQRLLFAFSPSLVETDIKITLFFVDTHQGLESREKKNLIACWKMEGSQSEIVKMLAIIIQVSRSAPHTWTGVECLLVTNFTKMETDTGKEHSALQLANPSRLWVIPGEGPHSPFIVVSTAPGTCRVLSNVEWMDQWIKRAFHWFSMS